ncbi:TetR/AcrR family transcriptional regulator [Amorphoplanes digitatis]|uniref:AcrR family transcriptional regulator n=1 Tax=Actinoplanes digitatis TaxID=1868 RepID=A0A7W7MSU8_9ACTN|nr:TetR/AcrR family transcriptional regulator [Actinoplanes digitatis]MBB4765095.1 AcrR family transcriptional regulator [Actinoplanes digitatis]BFE74809.1 TetR/AcrR family transcriptional regulator [Actinoplanes digitatis]GID97660.1 TetR family transcriptional regulator [Actinoplanes digitatis]
MRGAKPRGSYAKTDAKRDEILDAALVVFGESGYRRGSLKSIAGRVGMSDAGLLHHFQNKSALLSAVLARRDSRSSRLLDLDADDGLVVLRGLTALAARNAGTPGEVALFCTLSAEATDPAHPAHDYFARRYAETRLTVGRALGDLAQRGLLRAGVDTDSAARVTIAVMDGLQVQWLLDRSVDMAADLRHFLMGLVTVEL